MGGGDGGPPWGWQPLFQPPIPTGRPQVRPADPHAAHVDAGRHELAELQPAGQAAAPALHQPHRRHRRRPPSPTRPPQPPEPQVPQRQLQGGDAAEDPSLGGSGFGASPHPSPAAPHGQWHPKLRRHPTRPHGRRRRHRAGEPRDAGGQPQPAPRLPLAPRPPSAPPPRHAAALLQRRCGIGAWTAGRYGAAPQQDVARGLPALLPPPFPAGFCCGCEVLFFHGRC